MIATWLTATVVDTVALRDTVLAALGAGVGVTVAFSLAILGAARFTELNRDGRTVAAYAFGALAVVALVACAAAVAGGIFVMTSE